MKNIQRTHSLSFESGTFLLYFSLQGICFRFSNDACVCDLQSYKNFGKRVERCFSRLIVLLIRILLLVMILY
jgi:hypothetical protein